MIVLYSMWNTHLDFSILEKVGKRISDPRLPVDPWVKYAKIAVIKDFKGNTFGRMN